MNQLLNIRIKSGSQYAQEFADSRLINLDNDSITVLLTISDTINFQKESLLNYSCRIIRTNRKNVKIKVLYNDIRKLLEVEGIKHISLPQKLSLNTVISEGVELTNANIFHDASYHGDNINVAIIDAGWFAIGALQYFGEVPDALIEVEDCTDRDFGGDDPCGDHGSKCAQIIYDMTPNVNLHLIQIDDCSDYECAVNYCLNHNIDIINNSNSCFENYFDGSGGFCELVDDANSNGIVWVQPAGNYAKGHYEGTFQSSDGDYWHNFYSSDETIQFETEYSGQTVTITLTWDDWPSSWNDYDLFLYDNNLNEIDSSTTWQLGSAPIENINIVLSNVGTYRLSVKKFSASNLHFEIYLNGAYFSNYNNPSSSLSHPADCANAISVAAIDWEEWGTGPQKEYSSQGPTNDNRQKPDISAPTDIQCKNNCGGQIFTGTSAAAPHVAGAAALVLDRFPSYSPNQVKNYLYNNSNTSNLQNYSHNIYGYGKLLLNPQDVDFESPNTTISEGPEGWIDYNDVSFTSTGSDNQTLVNDLEYKYKLDSGSWSGWTSSTDKSYNNLSNGSHTFSVKAKDEAGNEDNSPDSRSFSIDTVDPSIPYFSTGPQPEGGWSTDNSPYFAWTSSSDNGSGLKKYLVEIDDDTPNDTPDDGNLVRHQQYSNVANGTHICYVRSEDNAGNKSDVDSLVFKIDTSPPLVYITYPENNSYFSTDDITEIVWEGNDGNGSGINYYQLKIDNSSWQNEGSNTSKEVENLSEGIHTFSVKAIDYVNYTSEIKEVEFTIDLTPPPSPSDLFWDSSPYSIDSEIIAQWGEPSDNLTGISAYHIQISTSAEFADTLVENNSLDSTKYSYDEGEHNTFYYFRLKARDGAGNWSSDWSYISDGIWVDLFSDPPQISNYSTTESSWRNDSTIQIVWEPTDLSGIASYEYKWQNITDGTETDWDTLYPPQTSLIDTLSDGKWIFYLRNTDALEGQDPSETVEYHLWIDTEAPGAPIGLSVQPIEWTNVNTLTVSWQTNPDDLSGIEAVRYQFENTTTWGMEDSISSKSFPITYPPEGITSTYIVLEDSAGNWLEANADTITVKYDITNPQLGSISWVDSTTHQTDSITFSLNDTLTLEWDSFEDDISGIEQFELNIITVVDTLIIFNESISGLEIDSNRTFSGLANHTTYFYQFNAIDSAGNVSEDIQPQFVTIDTIALPPAIDSLSTHLDNVWSNTDEVRLVFKPLDPSGIHLYYYKWYEDTVWDSTFSEHADFIELSDGKHTLQIKNMDATEVWVSDSIEHHIWIDTTPPNQPEISELSIDTLDNSIEISVSWSESVELPSETTSGFEKYYYTFVKDFPLARSITIDSTWSETTDTTIDSTIESEGIWEFMVAGSDVAQNYSEITYRTLPVDFGPPNPPDSLGYTVEIISATITWRKNTEGDIIKYHIYQKLLSSSGDYDWVEIGTTPYQVINFIVEDLPGPSMYYFSIRAEDIFKNMSDFSETINVWYEPPSPHAEFQITYSEIFPLEISFEDKSDSAAVNLAFWNWDFGDGTTSIEQHPTHQYLQNGVYTVTLKVIDEWGMSDDTSTTITLLPEFVLPSSPMLLEAFVNEPTSQELIIQNIGYGYLQWGYSVDGQLPDEFEISCGIENLSRSEGYSLALPQLMVENKVDTIIVPIYLSTVDTLKRLDFTIVDTPNELIGDTVNTAIQGLIITYEDNFGILDVTIESDLTQMIHPGENMPICEVLFQVNDSLSNISIDLNLIDVSLIKIDGTEVGPVSVTSGIIYYQSLYTLNPRSEEICEITYTPIDTYDDTTEISFFIDDIDSVDTVFTIVGVGIAKVGPLASFAAEYDDNRYTPLEVYFNNSTVLGTNDNATYNWENNNVVFSNDYSPTDTFHSPGNYNIKLTVTTDHGQPDSTNTLIEVIAPPPTSFSLLSPPDSISEFDRSCGVITFEWESSIDTNNHEIKYDLHLGGQIQSGELLFSIIEESIQDTFFTFSDISNLELDSTYYWKVTANNDWSSIECEEIFIFHISDKENCLNNARLILFPTEFEINTIYPNPFNPVTNIQFSTPEASNVYIHIYDLSGREVALLSEGHYPPGYHEVQWQANDFSSGIYFVHLTASSSRGDVLFNISKKVMLLK